MITSQILYSYSQSIRIIILSILIELLLNLFIIILINFQLLIL